MMGAALKGVLANKVRLTLTGLAIVLGVAFVAGSFIFTDTINTRFEILLERDGGEVVRRALGQSITAAVVANQAAEV